jgi:hypothetical protein
MTDQLKDYEVTEARFIGGQHRAVGEPVKMAGRAAKYYMQPHGTGLKVPGTRKEKVGGLDDPKVKNPTEHATGKPGK